MLHCFVGWYSTLIDRMPRSLMPKTSLTLLTLYLPIRVKDVYARTHARFLELQVRYRTDHAGSHLCYLGCEQALLLEWMLPCQCLRVLCLFLRLLGGWSCGMSFLTRLLKTWRLLTFWAQEPVASYTGGRNLICREPFVPYVVTLEARTRSGGEFLKMDPKSIPQKILKVSMTLKWWKIKNADVAWSRRVTYGAGNFLTLLAPAPCITCAWVSQI